MAKRKLTLEIVNKETGKMVRRHHFCFESDESNFLMLNIDGFYHKLNTEGMDYDATYCRIVERQAVCDFPFPKSSCDGSYNSSSHKE